MPATIHPAMKLNIVLDERSYENDAGAEMERRFTAVAPTEVVRATKGSQRANVLRFDVGTSAVDEDVRDPLWEGALITWLDEEFAETSALVARENDARRTNGERPIPFAWAEVRFGSGPVIAVRMVDSAIPAAAAGFVERARALLAAGALGADPIEVIRIPACVSIEAQREGAGGAGEGGVDAPSAQTLEEVRAVGRAERSSSSASDVVAAVTEAAGIDEEASGGWAAADPDAENAWAGSSSQGDGPTRAELDEALAEAEAALRRGADPADVDAEERAARAEAEAPVASVATPGSPEAVRRAGGEREANDDEASAVSTSTQPAGRSTAATSPQPEDDQSGEGCALVGGEVPETLDYRMWNVAYADGTSVRFDSVLGEAIID